MKDERDQMAAVMATLLQNIDWRTIPDLQSIIVAGSGGKLHGPLTHWLRQQMWARGPLSLTGVLESTEFGLLDLDEPRLYGNTISFGNDETLIVARNCSSALEFWKNWGIESFGPKSRTLYRYNVLYPEMIALLPGQLGKAALAESCSGICVSRREMFNLLCRQAAQGAPGPLSFVEGNLFFKQTKGGSIFCLHAFWEGNGWVIRQSPLRGNASKISGNVFVPILAGSLMF